MEIDIVAKRENLYNLLGTKLDQLDNAVKELIQIYEEEKTGMAVSRRVEELAIAHHQFIQVLSMLGYFEVLEAGEDPIA